jgi:biotin synthase
MVDNQSLRCEDPNAVIRDEILALADRVAQGRELSRAEALELAAGPTALDDVMAGAAVLARRFSSGEVEFCSVVNARSGRCPNDCAFCAQSVHHDTGAPVYELLDAGRIVAAAREAAASGACRFGIVTSGPAVDDETDLARILDAVRRTAALDTLEVCASLGLLTLERARRLKAAGLTRYHHNLETSRAFYPCICTTQGYEPKVETLRAARAAGLEICSGGIFGLGETWADRVDMALELRGVGVDSVAVNFLIPVAGTRLEGRPTLAPDEALRIVAVYRFLFPGSRVRVCGGREVILGERQPEMFAAGGDGAIIGNYLTTIGRSPHEDLEMVAALGLRVRTHAATPERA